MAPPTPPAPSHVESDIDLQDAVDHAQAQDQPQHGLRSDRGLGKLADLDAAGVITPGLLAKHHLPGILLDNGPLAIRHVMSYLTTSVPGFSGIPPAKARRLVVGALEGRGSGGEQGGINGDVIFEKVGWGRWDAKRRGHPSRDTRGVHHQNLRPARHSSPQTHGGLQIPGNSTRQDRSRDLASGTSTTNNFTANSHDFEMEYDNPSEDINMLEHEADKMSLDGDGSCSSSESPPDDSPILDYDIGDVTDEEDWASIGAAALRQGSTPLTSGGGRTHILHPNRFDYKSRGRGGGPPSSMLAKSMPMRNSTAVFNNYNNNQFQQQPVPPAYVGFSASDSQEREAIEALLRLGSV